MGNMARIRTALLIAVIVACTLPATGLVATVVQSRGVSEADVRVVRVWIEVSALVTGVIAVALGLLRAAAGIPTTFLVLVILGIGAVATAVFAKRRYGWPTAIIAFKMSSARKFTARSGTTPLLAQLPPIVPGRPRFAKLAYGL